MFLLFLRGEMEAQASDRPDNFSIGYRYLGMRSMISWHVCIVLDGVLLHLCGIMTVLIYGADALGRNAVIISILHRDNCHRSVHKDRPLNRRLMLNAGFDRSSLFCHKALHTFTITPVLVNRRLTPHLVSCCHEI